ncbi:hypothetical protein DIU31_003745 [Mucilaginibacter rubeus]|uniref:Uncharacterized protein n=1 Tax=Mucilaginibacter rubeus TaxID=2027860 RepID=A0AAE6MGQ1_9SPHI|nr:MULTISPECIES: hypothetical protein [Mucilaginibacter]QEM02673.1 hypothetical protein DIU31_003745 [Mucilaginibacter rubeus]QEM15292.1 hypothetical protein DIU38_003780 [Mucilaginibacter gossypii]QTE41979.1 hypothetical protein J3L19_24015 [Mucilaginibacter rubeus]QTE48580.1 hypothetical protein J3L21_23995 [Mucilaginibacter rubeus]QTE59967.1 hypothetical protein J3L23_15630 [Mucilaginibacter rubeus]
MKNHLIFLLTIILFGESHKIQVKEQITAIVVEKYLPQPSGNGVVSYKKTNYQIKSVENFDKNGSLNSVSFLESEGWLEFKREEFSGIRDFFKASDLTPKLECQIIGKNLMKINTDTIAYDSLNMQRRMIYYFKKNDRKWLFILKF